MSLRSSERSCRRGSSFIRPLSSEAISTDGSPSTLSKSSDTTPASSSSSAFLQRFSRETPTSRAGMRPAASVAESASARKLCKCSSTSAPEVPMQSREAAKPARRCHTRAGNPDERQCVCPTGRWRTVKFGDQLPQISQSSILDEECSERARYPRSAAAPQHRSEAAQQQGSRGSAAGHGATAKAAQQDAAQQDAARQQQAP
jgi:hypothetical protein